MKKVVEEEDKRSKDPMQQEIIGRFIYAGHIIASVHLILNVLLSEMTHNGKQKRNRKDI